MDENTVAEHSWIIIVMCVFVAFLAFAPDLGNMLNEYGQQMLSAHFE